MQVVQGRNAGGHVVYQCNLTLVEREISFGLSRNVPKPFQIAYSEGGLIVLSVAFGDQELLEVMEDRDSELKEKRRMRGFLRVLILDGSLLPVDPTTPRCSGFVSVTAGTQTLRTATALLRQNEEFHEMVEFEGELDELLAWPLRLQ